MYVIIVTMTIIASALAELSRWQGGLIYVNTVRLTPNPIPGIGIFSVNLDWVEFNIP